MLIIDNNNVSCMVDVVGHFTNSVEMVVDFFTGTFEVTNALLLLPKHRLLAVFYNYYNFIEVSKEIIVELYNLQFLNPESDSTGSEGTLSSVIASSRAALVFKEREDEWFSTTGILPVPSFIPHIIHFPSTDNR